MAGIPSAAELQAYFDDSPAAPELFPNSPIQSLGSQVSWALSNISPAAYLYIYREETLEWNLWNAISGATYTLSGLQIGTDGALHELQFVRTPTSDRALNSYTFPMDEGFLLGLSVRVSSGTVTRGSAYTQVSLVRGSGTTLLPLHTLLADSLTTLSRLGWPGSPIRQSVEGPGTIRLIAGTQPAAGAEVSETVPSGARWRLIMFRALLATSATSADRYIGLRVVSGTFSYALREVDKAHPASVTLAHSFVAGQGSDAVVKTLTTYSVGIGEIILAAGTILATATQSLQSGDQYSNVQYMVEEWIET